jgi:Cu+-exporting ATPase
MATQSTIELAPAPVTAADRDGPTDLEVAGMSCGHCAQRVTEAIQGVPGVRSAAVDLETQRAQVRWQPGAGADVAAVIAAVEQLGYQAGVAQAPARDHG